VSQPTQAARALAPAAAITLVQVRFLLSVLPKVEAHARICFRHVRCPGRREDAVAEAVALAWRWSLRLGARGKDAGQFAGAIATFAARQVRSGRRLCGQEAGKDALSPLAQARHGFLVQLLPSSETGVPGNPVLEALRDDGRTPPPEQAAFRIDFPVWLCRLGRRNRQLAEEMAQGETTLELAGRHGLSPPRVSQLRRQFHDDWQKFHGEGGR
jgi:hypothetical protein